jgi:hypothetical protein
VSGGGRDFSRVPQTGREKDEWTVVRRRSRIRERNDRWWEVLIDIYSANVTDMMEILFCTIIINSYSPRLKHMSLSFNRDRRRSRRFQSRSISAEPRNSYRLGGFDSSRLGMLQNHGDRYMQYSWDGVVDRR